MGWDFNLSAAMGAMVRTAPFIVVRMIVYFGIALGYILATGVGGALGYGFTSFGDGEGVGAFWGAMFGFVGASGVLYWAREYILYIVKAAHIAVLVHHHDGKDLPEGKGQVDYAQAVVRERFAEASVLFGIDQLIEGVLTVIQGTLNTVANLLPIPGLDNLAKIIGAVIRVSLTFVDEVILAYNIRTNSQNAWASSADALVLYAQNYGKLVKNAVWLSLFMWLLTFLIFLILLGPTFWIMSAFPGDIGFWAFIVAFIFAWSVKAALVEPFAVYALMQVFFSAIEGQDPDEVWRSRLEQASEKFREIKQKATEAITPSQQSPT